MSVEDTAGAMAELVKAGKALPPGAAAGTRYPEGGMKGVYL